MAVQRRPLAEILGEVDRDATRARRMGVIQRTPTAAPASAPRPEEVPAAQQPQPEVSTERPAMPATAPAAIAASGTREPPSAAAPAPEPEPDGEAEDPFPYMDRVNAMVDAAMKEGRTDIAEKIMGEYEGLITKRFRAMEAHYDTRIMPDVKRVQAELQRHQGRMLPQQLRDDALKVAEAAQTHQADALVYAYGLMRNPLTKPMGLKLVSATNMIAPGAQVADVGVVEGPNGEPIIEVYGPDGQPVPMARGEPFRVPLDAAEAAFQERYGTGKDGKLTVLNPGDIAVDSRGRQRAANTSPARGAGGQADDDRANVNMARQELALAFGAKVDPISRMLDTSAINDPEAYTAALAEVEDLIRSGVPPMQAQALVVQRYRGAARPGAGAGDSGGQYTGPRPWRGT